MQSLKLRFYLAFSIFFFFLAPFAFLFSSPLSFIFFFLIAFAFLASLFYLVQLSSKSESDSYLDQLEEGLVILDSSLHILKINTLAKDVFGLDQSKTTLPAYYPEVLAFLRQALEQKKSLSMTFQSKTLKKVFELTAHIQASEIILLIQDQTKNYQVMEMGRDFVANASHELKTPITIVRGFAETLYEHLDLTEDVRKSIAKKIISNCDRMEALVKKLLALSALDEGISYERLHKCNLKEIAKKAEATVKSFHSGANIVLDIAPNLFIRADKELFIQALVNLLDNAVKYSGKMKKVLLKITQDETHIIIEVIDEGVGMKQEAIPRIFERFYSIDKAASRKLGGFGLGLSIVEQIVARHGGNIEVTSEEDKGSCFKLTFPKTP